MNVLRAVIYRRIPDHRIFQRLHHQLSELGSFHLNRPRLLFMGTSEESFVALISEAIASVREIPAIFERARQSLYRR